MRATGGRVGQVDEFVVDPESGYITHLALREGHLWGDEEVTIPVSEIVKIEEDVVHLKLNKEQVEVTIPEVRQLVAQKLAENPKIAIALKVSRAAPYRTMIAVYDQLKLAKAERISLMPVLETGGG